MTESELLLQELKTIRKTLDHHGNKIEILAEAFTKMAVQNEQITYLQTQTNTLWQKVDDITGHHGIVTKIRDHQARCPKEEMHRTFRWMWAALGVHSVIFLFLIGAMLKAV